MLIAIPSAVLALGLTTAIPVQQGGDYRRSDPQVRLLDMDVNHDGVVTREEWRGSDQSFREHDWNHDGVLSGDEVRDGADRQVTERSDARFRNLDRNGDNRLSRREWSNHGENDVDLFDRSDINGDGFISRREFSAIGGDYDRGAVQSRAYRAGYDRGVIEGREAGREDKVYRNQWDLEGQSELEQADSGYTSTVGSRSDYQAGYRAGFRRAYAERFGPH